MQYDVFLVDFIKGDRFNHGKLTVAIPLALYVKRAENKHR